MNELKHLPFIYTPEESVGVYEQTSAYLEGSDLKPRIVTHANAYRAIGELIPHTAQSFGSGHFFPWSESWEELQVSYNLALFGFYKQAMTSLRSGLELGLLSVYWNLNDDGHREVKMWLRAEQDTPRIGDIWSKLSRHHNFQFVAQRYELKERLLEIDFLHNWVHSKGHRFSNRCGLPSANFQTFEEKALVEWTETYEEVVKVLAICHLTKYPIGVVEYEWSDKFGFDKPMFGGLEPHEVEQLLDVLDDKVVEILRDLSRQDGGVESILGWVNSMPDMTPEVFSQQVMEWDKFMITMQRFTKWLESERRTIENLGESSPEWNHRIEMLREWSIEEGCHDAPLRNH